MTPARRLHRGSGMDERLIREARERGFLFHFELDLLLAGTETPRAFETRVRKLLGALDRIELRRSPPGAEPAPMDAQFDFDLLVRRDGRAGALATYVREVGAIPQMDREAELR